MPIYNIKIGVLRETKNPPDRRVALPPQQALELTKRYPEIKLCIQPSTLRAYHDEEYTALGLKLQEDLSDCDVLIGVKEVEISALIPNKTYLFFSHTAKKQEFNRPLLQAMVEKNITMVDYEYLTNEHNQRLVAFGRWAGIVGAYNGLLGYGLRSGKYNLRRAHECHDMDEFFAELAKVKLDPIKILLTGGGRVAHGAMETLEPLNIKKVSPQEFLKKTFDMPVYTQLDPWHYNKRKDGDPFDLEHFFKHPYEYESTFKPYLYATDLFIACHFWDPKAPRFFSVQDMQAPEFKTRVIADVSCDLGGPIPSTLRVSTIETPFYGFDVKKNAETEAFREDAVTVMAVDNLPGEAPRNASLDFGNNLIDKILPSIIEGDNEEIIKRATITENGRLTPGYAYLQGFLEGKE